MRTILALLFLPCILFAEASSVPDYKVHEAFIARDQNTIILQAVPIKPPQEISERVPKNKIKDAVWIPGYWSWSAAEDRYVWMTGTWRVPPPGHQWVPGKWKSFDEGWVWLHGFWSPDAEKDLTYINRPPPDRVDEKIGQPPASNYFWLPGHWSYNSDIEDFVWYTGRYEEFNQKWQYVPSHFIWRDKGYVLIEGYWDWNLEDRGIAYAAVEIPQDEIETIAYKPRDRVSVAEICRIYYPQWPDYYMHFQHWYFYHPDFDFGLGAVPAWWSWSSWWAFNGVDLWWLWWWWSHPGYPHPFFINAELASEIPPPGELVTNRMQKEEPLPFIAPNGVINVQDLIHAVENFTGHSEPVLPSSPEEVFEIQEEARPTTRPARTLMPTGEQAPLNAPNKPFFGPERDDFSQPPQPTPTPNYPTASKRQKGEAVKQQQPVKLRARTYEGEEKQELPQAQPNKEVPQRYPQRNNTRTRPPYPESYRSREYTPKPRYAPPAQQYTPRKTPATYKPQEPSKPRYQPRSQSSQHPTYKAPSKKPTNGYNQIK